MKTKIFLLGFLTSVSFSETLAQRVYVDLLVAPAMVVYANALKGQQNDAERNLKNVRNGQILVQGQLQVANDLHDKVLKGLREVSGTVNNALTIKRIYETSSDIIAEVQDAVELAAQNPQYAIFASRAVSTFRQRAIQLSADVSRVIAGGENNMMDSGERQRLLQSIHRDLRLIWGAAYGMNASMKAAIRAGFWRSLNPFSSWVSQDARIMRNILREAASS
ncbi:MAG: hypothetical protein M5Z89_04985 [Olivibacter sp.]|nr:hypothetical protein [Olivibacter sp. UJ_SKK_5.1]